MLLDVNHPDTKSSKNVYHVRAPNPNKQLVLDNDILLNLQTLMSNETTRMDNEFDLHVFYILL